MNADLSTALARYQQNLEHEVALLEALVRTARAQRDGSRGSDVAVLVTASTERDEQMAALLDLERSQRALRARVAGDLQAARGLPGFAVVCELHRAAERLLDELASADRDTRAHLEEAEFARRAAAHALDAGEATLAAYRKVLTPGERSSIVDSRG